MLGKQLGKIFSKPLTSVLVFLGNMEICNLLKNLCFCKAMGSNKQPVENKRNTERFGI